MWTPIRLVSALLRMMKRRERRGCDQANLTYEALAVCGQYADPDGRSRVATDHDDHLVNALR